MLNFESQTRFCKEFTFDINCPILDKDPFINHVTISLKYHFLCIFSLQASKFFKEGHFFSSRTLWMCLYPFIVKLHQACWFCASCVHCTLHKIRQTIPFLVKFYEKSQPIFYNSFVMVINGGGKADSKLIIVPLGIFFYYDPR